MAARSTTAGTPVKSCSSTRAGVKAISADGSASGSHVARASMSSARHGDAVLVAQQVLEQDLQREGQAGDVVLGLKGVEAVDLEFTVAHAQRVAGAEGVL